ncbi:MAG: SDR family oxidoreductase [Gluconacetobacter diazotrophicus]|nr:SDR family oxidoreductase [Gluconacetobacter diazotrophicus]
MRVFVTGATGFIGSAVVQELLTAGHEVLGLTRSEEGAGLLRAAGAQAHHGDLQDLESLRRGAGAADAVIHTAFVHDFTGAGAMEAACETDRRAIEALGEVLAGSDRPLLVTAGMSAATEEEEPRSIPGLPPRQSEQTALALAGRGVRASVVRVPQVHDRDKQGAVTYLIALARQKGVSAYVGDGRNGWPAVHRHDAAALYRHALERGTAGKRYHAVAEEGVPLRQIAEAIGRGLKLPAVSLTPAEAAEHFGWIASFVGMDAAASSALTRERLGWHPTAQPGLLDDLRDASVFRA